MSNPRTETLEPSEQRYKKLADSFPQTVAETDEKGNITFANANGLEMFGYTKEDFDKGLNIMQMLIPEDRARAREKIQRILNGEKVGGGGYTALKKDGTTFPVTIYTSPMLIGNKPSGLRAIVIDTTEHVHAEKALRNSEERYRQLAESINIGIGVAQDSMLKFVNPMFMKVMGYSKHDLTTLPFINFIYPDDRNMVLERHIRRMKGEQFPTRYEFRILAGDGNIKWVELDSVMIQWEGKPARLAFMGDITDRKQMERALKESEEKFITSFLKSPNPLAITAMKDGRYFEVNEAFTKVMGLKREELIDNTSIGAGFITAEQRARFMDEYQQKGSVENLELSMRVKGGELRYGLFNSSKITIGKEDFFLTQVTDITELKRTQVALRESEERYRSIYENAIEGMYQASPEGRYISVNPSLARMHGFESPQEMITAVSDIGSQIFMSPEARKEYREILEREGAVVNFEFELYRKDRNKIWVSTSAHVVRNEKGETLYYDGKVEDITKRKQAEKALKKSGERFRNLAELLPEAVFEMDMQGVLTFSNNKAFDIFGYTAEDFAYDLNVFDMVTPDDRGRVLKNTQKIVNGENIGPNEYTLRRKDGSIFPSMIHSTAIVHDGKPVGFRGVVVDITDHKRAEEEREKFILDLQEALRKVKLLSGLLPVCASCKKIRNDEGYWEQIEVYIRDHSEAEFSHGICPECAEKLYPELYEKK